MEPVTITHKGKSAAAVMSARRSQYLPFGGFMVGWLQ